MLNIVRDTVPLTEWTLKNEFLRGNKRVIKHALIKHALIKHALIKHAFIKHAFIKHAFIKHALKPQESEMI